MKLTRRTLFRHLLVAFVLMAMIPVAIPFQGHNLDSLLAWVTLRSPFLLGLLLFAASSGSLAYIATRRRGLHLLLLALFPRTERRDLFRTLRRGGGPALLRWIFLWSGCSRCVSYWLGALGGALLGLGYWGNAVAALYFGLLCAALSAAIATSLHLVAVLLERSRGTQL